MIAIINYDTGNLRSVTNALHRAGAEFIITSEEKALRSATKVIMPGVGEASSAMAKLCERGLHHIIPTLTQPLLGICIGEQLLCEMSEEGDAECLGIFPTKVKRLPSVSSDGERLKVPHIGWDTIENLKSPLFRGIRESSYLYYVHSFAAELCAATIASTTYGTEFSAALNINNFYGTQFHPEKSGGIGEAIIKNFLEL